jgi:hypothetical protein
MLAYHPDLKQVKILLLLLAYSDRDDNAIRLLHRGQVDCSVIRSWPLPLHPSEPAAQPEGSGEKAILEQFYGRMFSYDPKTDALSRVGALTRWDATERIQPAEPVFVTSARLPLAPDPCGPEEGPVPFTAWTLSGRPAGWNLLAFEVSIVRDTYDRFLAPSSAFTIDGPECIARRIRYGDLAAKTERTRGAWEGALWQFTDPCNRLDCSSHDIVLIQTAPAARVVRVPELSAGGVYSSRKHVSGTDRYLTSDPSFTLPLAFASDSPLGPEAAAYQSAVG